MLIVLIDTDVDKIIDKITVLCVGWYEVPVCSGSNESEICKVRLRGKLSSIKLTVFATW